MSSPRRRARNAVPVAPRPRVKSTQASAGSRTPAATARAVMRGAPVGLLIVDDGGKVRFANPRSGRLFGRAAALLIGRPADRFLAPDDRARWRQAFATSARKRPEPAEALVRVADQADDRALDVAVVDRRDDPAVRGFLVTARDATALAARQRELLRLAYVDSVTGLVNRTRFVQMLERAVSWSREQHRGIGVLALDLNDFKMVNDAYGHAAGDHLLAMVAARLTGLVRPDDVVGRLGGDEFGCVLFGVKDDRTATAAAERVLATVGGSTTSEGFMTGPSANVGIAVTPLAGQSADEALRAAEAALDEAKKRGRGHFVVYEEKLVGRGRERAEVETALRRGIEADELRLAFQPLVDLGTGKIRQAEALVRWAHPTRGLLSPGAFVPIAEETGLIIPLGAWVLREACRQAREWNEMSGISGVAVNVNLSATQLRRPGLAREVVSALHETGLDPRLLTLELTESAAVADPAAATAVMRQLRVLGVRLALDDFGTGHSSLAYLHTLPVDEVKIDKAFVRGLGRDRVAEAIMMAVLTVADAVGLRVVAEGIETEEQLRAVTELGCDVGQGHLFGRPFASAAFSDRLAATFGGVFFRVVGMT